jgi:hypothetical protein
MRTFSFLTRIFLRIFVLAAIASCGGGGGGGEPIHPPSISNLVYSPATALQAPNGTSIITGTIDFTDAGGDVGALHMVTSAGADLTIETPSLSGIKEGKAVGELVVSVNEIGKYTFEVWMTDAQGNASNRLSGTFEVRPDDSGTNWTKLDVSPPNILLGIARNSGQYMAVGMGGTVMTSPDLNSWAVRTSDVIHNLRSVASSGSRLVAVGDSAIGEPIVISSMDGVTWSVQYRGGSCGADSCATPSMLSSVIWTGTQFIAVGQERIFPGGSAYALILTSPDGLNWTQQAVQAIVLGQPKIGTESGITSVAWSGNLLVAVGIAGDGYPAAWTSTDAEAWTRRTVPGNVGYNLRDITWGTGRFVAVGWGGVPAVFTSSDGINWQGNSGDASLPAMNAVTTGVSNYLAVSNVFREVSADGLAWTVAPSPDCGNDVLWDGLRYVSVGGSICRSP